MKTYLLIYFGATILAIVFTPIVIMLARKRNVVDKPGIRSSHVKPVPRIGGIAIFISSMVFIIIVLFLNNAIGKSFRDMRIQYLTLLFTATFIFFIGLVDDLRGLPARFKLLAELLASCTLCIAGVHISSIEITEKLVIQFGILSFPLSILWIVGVTNAVNLSDGLDGLAAGISTIACGVIAVFAIQSNNVIMAVLMLALLGSLTGFLFFNFNPAKIFMGDCGSLFLGYTIASSSILCSMKSSVFIALALPFLALGVPIFDTIFTMLRRFLERRSIFAPDRKHFHHCLVEAGIKQQHVVIIIYLLTLLCTGLGMLMMVTRNIDSLLIFICVTILLVIIFRSFGYVRLRTTLSALKKKYDISSRFKREKANFEKAQLYFYDAKSHQQQWAAMCNAAERLGFVWLSLRKKYGNGQTDVEFWRISDKEYDLSQVVIMKFPINGNGNGVTFEFEVAIMHDGSYESAGYRATLFNRLVDENAFMYS